MPFRTTVPHCHVRQDDAPDTASGTTVSYFPYLEEPPVRNSLETSDIATNLSFCIVGYTVLDMIQLDVVSIFSSFEFFASD